MVALVLFRPREDFPDRRNFLETEYFVYMYILQQHLLRECPTPVEARTKFLAVLSIIEEFLTLSRAFLAILDRIDPSQITHFIKEIFDL